MNLFFKLDKIMSMKPVTGLGGVFINANDPEARAAWYQNFLAIGFNNNSYIDPPFTAG